MKRIIYIVLGLVLTNIANAASVNYRFVGNSISDQEIDFTLAVDFEREGFIINGDGSIFNFDPTDPLRDTFFVDYQSGNYSLAPSTNQFQRFYGETGVTVEGLLGCLYALNSIAVCDIFGDEFGGPPTWQVGRRLELILSDSMEFFSTSVRLESITAVPLPAPFLLMVSGLISLIGLSRRKAYYNT